MQNYMTATVASMAKINISGNIIPATWWKNVKMPSGKPDCKAIMLLSEIVYWYRPMEVRDEYSGEFKGFRKRFSGDKLQRSYQSFADRYGFTKREVTVAIKRLSAQGLITIEFRTINTAKGVANNVLFIEPVVAKIEKITHPGQQDNFSSDASHSSLDPITNKRYSSCENSADLSQKNAIAPPKIRQTNTKDYNKINKDITDGVSDGADTPITEANKLNYQQIIAAYHNLLPDMPEIRVLTDARKRMLKNFWQKFKFNQQRWENYLTYIADHCRWMQQDRENGRGGLWRRKNLDYLITERCYVAVKEERANDK
ncbi:MAG TPA: hypothetical protein ACHBY4_11615 [Arsenophonus apicola]|uniref:hypothetical protein n=1 Tax=Arsenophonus apicola TaxID=2879119 RepID=UPI00387913FE